MTKIKWHEFRFSMKKGENKKYKKHLDYIHKNYFPEFLSISQLNFYEHMRNKPIPVIEFSAPCISALDIMDDFTEKFSKTLMVGGSQPKEWVVEPKLTEEQLKVIKERHKKMKNYLDGKEK